MYKETERPLLNERDDESDIDGHYPPRLQTRRTKTLEISIALNVVLLAIAFVFGTTSLMSSKAPTCQDVYSPAQGAIEYRTQVFRSGLHDDWTEYQGPGEEVLQNWEDLYNDIGMTQVDHATALKLPNATTPTTYDQSKYVVQLDVFHTLHCLNMLRKRLYPDVYPPGDDKADELYHLEHCVESIRQSLQCSSDVSTIFWEWSEKQQKTMGNLQTTHTCRNFEKIQQWAREHSMPEDTDLLQHVPGAPLRVE